MDKGDKLPRVKSYRGRDEKPKLWYCEVDDRFTECDHQMINLPIVTVGAVSDKKDVEVIIIMNRYAYMSGGWSIHSSIKLEHFKVDVNDKPFKVRGGKQQIETIDGFIFLPGTKNGLAYIKMRPFTDEE